MQNPLEAPTYRVGNECYRRNVPWEEVKTANPAAAAEYSGEEADTDEANDVQQTVEFSAADEQKADEMADALPNKSELQDGSEQIGSIDFMAASTSKTTAKSSVQKVELKVQGKEIKVSKNKSKAAVQVEQKEAKVELVAEKKIELIGSVKYDPKQESYNDSLRMPSALIGFLRGREGHKQKKLESKFRCNIHFPKKRSNKMETEIKIASTESANSVLNCRQEIEQLLVQARKQAMPTHFVSIPIFDPRLREQYQTLVKRIMEDEETPEECKNVKLFLPTAKLHLTICVLKLFTDEELDRAKRHLDELFRTDKIREILANNATIRLQFPALEHFADRSPDKVAVLFARAESERMQKLANVVDDALAETGLSERRKTENVVLHMTVMNTKYLWEVCVFTNLFIKPKLGIL